MLLTTDVSNITFKCLSPDELYLALVLSTKAHAKILSVDTTDALKIPGAVDYIDYKDVPGSNIIGHIINDEEIFATRSVSAHNT